MVGLVPLVGGGGGVGGEVGLLARLDVGLLLVKIDGGPIQHLWGVVGERVALMKHGGGKRAWDVVLGEGGGGGGV